MCTGTEPARQEPFGKDLLQQKEWIRRKGETLKFPVSVWSVGALAVKAQALWGRLVCVTTGVGKEHRDEELPPHARELLPCVPGSHPCRKQQHTGCCHGRELNPH